MTMIGIAMGEGFDPYYEWLGIPPRDQPPNWYRLLGIEQFEANCNVIERAADRQMGHLRTFQAGAHTKESQRLLNEVSTARIGLLSSERKAAYDAKLRAEAEAAFPVFELPPAAAPVPPPVSPGTPFPTPRTVADEVTSHAPTPVRQRPIPVPLRTRRKPRHRKSFWTRPGTWVLILLLLLFFALAGIAISVLRDGEVPAWLIEQISTKAPAGSSPR